MTRTRILLTVLAAGFAWAVLHLFGLEFAGGDVYPEYSSLRADPLGAKLLYDTVERVPGMRVSRNFGPLDEIAAPGVVLLLGWDPASAAEEAAALERRAARGLRIAIALHPRGYVRPDVFSKSWPLRVAADPDRRRVHTLYFSDAGDWTVLDRVGAKILAVEKRFGSGAVAIWSESDDFANQSTAALDRLDTVSRAIGPFHHVIFDEQHLGIRESGSVIGLARRFRLTGLALGLGLVAALALWRAASAFPPVEQRPVERLEGRTSHAGLVALLRRNIPASELAAVCWREWLVSHGRAVKPDRIARAAAIVDDNGVKPLATLREVQSVLSAKGMI